MNNKPHSYFYDPGFLFIFPSTSLVRRYLERLPGNFVIISHLSQKHWKPFLCEAVSASRGDSKTNPPELCSALPGGNCFGRNLGLTAQAGSYHEPAFIWWAGTLPGTFCQPWGQLWHLQGWIPVSPPKPNSSSKAQEQTKHERAQSLENSV